MNYKFLEKPEEASFAAKEFDFTFFVPTSPWKRLDDVKSYHCTAVSDVKLAQTAVFKKSYIFF